MLMARCRIFQWVDDETLGEGPAAEDSEGTDEDGEHVQVVGVVPPIHLVLSFTIHSCSDLSTLPLGALRKAEHSASLTPPCLKASQAMTMTTVKLSRPTEEPRNRQRQRKAGHKAQGAPETTTQTCHAVSVMYRVPYLFTDFPRVQSH